MARITITADDGEVTGTLAVTAEEVRTDAGRPTNPLYACLHSEQQDQINQALTLALRKDGAP